MFHGIRINNLPDNDSLKLHYSGGPEIQEVIIESLILKKKIEKAQLTNVVYSSLM